MPRGPDIIIRAGTTESDPIEERFLRDGDLAIYAPTGALAGVTTVQVSPAAGQASRTLQSPPGTDMAIAQGKAIGVKIRGLVRLSLKTTVAPGTDETYLTTYGEELP